jgi:hypothetical protein
VSSNKDRRRSQLEREKRAERHARRRSAERLGVPDGAKTAPSSHWGAAKMSDVLSDFAQPLIADLGRSDLRAMQGWLRLASLIWNEVSARTQDALDAGPGPFDRERLTTEATAAILSRLPADTPALVGLIRSMIDDKLARFLEDTRIISGVEVVGTPTGFRVNTTCTPPPDARTQVR